MLLDKKLILIGGRIKFVLIEVIFVSFNSDHFNKYVRETNSFYIKTTLAKKKKIIDRKFLDASLLRRLYCYLNK